MNWRPTVTGIGAALVTLLAAHGAVAFVQWEWSWLSEWSESGRVMVGGLALCAGCLSALVESNA